MNKPRNLAIALILVMTLLFAGPSLDVSARPMGASDPGLGTAASASILAPAGVTNAGTSSTNRDVDVYPGPPCGPLPAGLTVGGAEHFCDGVAQTALADAGTADGNMLGQALTSNEGPALDGLTLVSGVYDIGAGRLNGGVLTLDGPGFYIFRASSDFISSGSIVFQNGARACDLFWHVQSLATINGTSFAGTIIAGTGVHFGDSVTLDGRALALTGDVTLINDTIIGPTCPRPAEEDGGDEDEDAGGRPSQIRGLPNTGGGPIQNEDAPWGLVIVGGFSAAALVLGIRSYRRTHLTK
jgi:type VI secretion system secreted protein VgrG